MRVQKQSLARTVHRHRAPSHDDIGFRFPDLSRGGQSLRVGKGAARCLGRHVPEKRKNRRVVLFDDGWFRLSTEKALSRPVWPALQEGRDLIEGAAPVPQEMPHDHVARNEAVPFGNVQRGLPTVAAHGVKCPAEGAGTRVRTVRTRVIACISL